MRAIAKCERCGKERWREELRIVEEHRLCYRCGEEWTPYEDILKQCAAALGDADIPYRDIPAAIEKLHETWEPYEALYAHTRRCEDRIKDLEAGG